MDHEARDNDERKAAEAELRAKLGGEFVPELRISQILGEDQIEEGDPGSFPVPDQIAETLVVPAGMTVEQLSAEPPDKDLLRGDEFQVIDKKCEACGLRHRVVKDDKAARCRACKGLIWQPSEA